MRLRDIHHRVITQEFIASFSIMGLRVFMLGSKFLLALFIVRYIGLAELGIYGLIGGACAIIPMALRMGIFSNIARLAVNQPLDDLTCNLYRYGVGTVTLYALLLPIVLITGWHLGQLPIVALAFFVIVTEHLCIDVFVIANNRRHPKLANLLLALQSAFWIYPFMIAAFFFPSLRTLNDVLAFWMAGGIFSFALAIFLTRHWPWKQALSQRIPAGWHKTFITSSWRIYAAEMMSTVSLYLDRYMITAFLSLEMTGIYVLFWQVTNGICNLIGAGILQRYTPQLVSAHQVQNEILFRQHFKESAVKSLGVTYALSFIAAIIIPFLISYTGHTTAMGYFPLLWMMLAALGFRVGGDICSYTLYAKHRDDLVLHSVIVKLACGTAVGVAALYFMGIYGVIPMMMAAGFSIMLYTAFALRKRSLS